MSEIDIRAEVSKVENELTLFREKYVLALLGRRSIHASLSRMSRWCTTEWRNEPVSPPTGKGQPAGWLSYFRWGRCQRTLGKSLVRTSGSFSSGATPAFRIGGGRIIWEIELFMGRQLVQELLQKRDLPVPIENLPTGLAELGRWLLRQLIDYKLTDDLCSLLPFLADVDPAFARLVLGPETWRKIALAEQDEGAERTDWLEYVEGLWFAHCLNNALLHVLGALANNRFEKIEVSGPSLPRPPLHTLMPHYVFAVLFGKVVILRQLSREQQELWTLSDEPSSSIMDTR